LSIAKTLLEDEPFSNFILVYGNKTPKDAMFVEELLHLKKPMAIVFMFILFIAKRKRKMHYLVV
jgi:ferredoxin-NADP reductase